MPCGNSGPSVIPEDVKSMCFGCVVLSRTKVPVTFLSPTWNVIVSFAKTIEAGAEPAGRHVDRTPIKAPRGGDQGNSPLAAYSIDEF